MTMIRFINRYFQKRHRVARPTVPHRDEAINFIAGVIDPDFYANQFDAPQGLDGEFAATHYVDIGALKYLDPRADFSTKGYLDDNPDVRIAGLNPLYHYLKWGKSEGRPVRSSQRASTAAPQLQFQLDSMVAIVRAHLDSSFYRAEVEKLSPNTIIMDLAKHYIDIGAKQDLDPSPYFSTSEYKRKTEGVDWSTMNPLVHSVVSALTVRATAVSNLPDGGAEIDQNVIDQFDAQFYLEQNADVEIAGVDPVVHFFATGWKEGRDPSAQFSTTYYLNKYEDIRKAGVNPFVHFVLTGSKEGRIGHPRAEHDKLLAVMKNDFDPDYYLRNNTDVREAGIDPFLHFMENGWREHRDPSPEFSVRDYLDDNPDVRASGSNPFVHFVTAGRSEGRLPKTPGGFRSRLLKNQETFEERISARRFQLNVGQNASDTISRWAKHLPRESTVYITVSHDNFMTNVGGVQLCLQRELLEAQRRDWDHVHLFPTEVMPSVSDRSGGALGIILNGEVVGAVSPSDLQIAFAGLKSKARYVSVHSFIGHNIAELTDIIEKARPTEVFFWVHDFASLCTSYTLMRNDVKYCAAPALQSTSCQICIYGQSRVSQYQQHSAFLKRFNVKTLAPSRSAADIWRTGFPDLPPASVLPHCYLRDKASEKLKQTPRRRGQGPLRIAFLGWPSSHKGWEVFCELAERFARDARYEFHHLGGGHNSTLPAIFSPVAVTIDDPRAMVNAMRSMKIDLALVWSLWPETFCFTAHEALAAGASIITHQDSGNVGALASEMGGMVLESEEALFDRFRDGDIVAFIRGAPRRTGLEIEYGCGTLEVIPLG